MRLSGGSPFWRRGAWSFYLQGFTLPNSVYRKPAAVRVNDLSGVPDRRIKKWFSWFVERTFGIKVFF